VQRKYELRLDRQDTLFRGIEPVDVEVEDGPVYDGKKSFRAYPLNALLQQHLPVSRVRRDGYTVRFIARDGYTVSVSLEEVLEGEGMLAFEEPNADSGDWMSFQKGKKQITPAPFYLVWPEVNYEKHGLPWAYQLETIEVEKSKANRWGQIEPNSEASDQIKKGYKLFTDYCGRCHSINLVGGSVGPELNVPMNVTEYWRESHLAVFIENPSAYRAGSAMPSFAGLSDGDIHGIIGYLRSMTSRKICKTARECQQTLDRMEDKK
jgi:cytochrome c2